jgi:hypothetical protein
MRTVNRPSCSRARRRGGSGSGSTNGVSGEVSDTALECLSPCRSQHRRDDGSVAESPMQLASSIERELPGRGVRGNSAHYTQAIGDRSDAPRRRLAELAITCYARRSS